MLISSRSDAVTVRLTVLNVRGAEPSVIMVASYRPAPRKPRSTLSVRGASSPERQATNHWLPLRKEALRCFGQFEIGLDAVGEVDPAGFVDDGLGQFVGIAR